MDEAVGVPATDLPNEPLRESPGPGPIPSEAIADCINVLERILASPATRAAWLLGFITGSALVGEDSKDCEALPLEKPLG
jgi:hypothetical protein